MNWWKGQILICLTILLTGCNTLTDSNSDAVDLAKILKNQGYLNSKGAHRQFTVLQTLDRIAVLEFSTEFDGVPSFDLKKSNRGDPMVTVYFFAAKEVATPAINMLEFGANTVDQSVETAKISTSNDKMIGLTVRKLHADELQLTSRDLLYSIFGVLPDTVKGNKKLEILEDKPEGIKFLFLNGGVSGSDDGLLFFGKVIREQDTFLIWQYAFHTAAFAIDQPKQYPIDLTKIVQEVKRLDYTIFCDLQNPSEQCLMMQRRLINDLRQTNKVTFKPFLTNPQIRQN